MQLDSLSLSLIDLVIFLRAQIKLSDRVELVGDRKRSYYLPADLKLIHEHLALFINTKEPLIKSEFESYVLGKPELQELVSKYGLEKLRIKVCTERKSS